MSSARSTSSTRFAPRVEGLEDRTVPSGNVQAYVLDGVLHVVGDDQGNQITIAAYNDDGATISSPDGTTINGQAGSLFAVGVHGINAYMNDGDDVLVVSDTRFDDTLVVDMGAGNDALTIVNAGHAGDTLVRGGTGNDTITLKASRFDKRAIIDTGDGDDQVVASFVAANKLLMFNPGGSDFFSHEFSRADDPQIFGFAEGARPDTTAPTAALTTAAPNPTNAPIDFTVTFSKPVSGFTAAGIAVTNGTVGSFTQVDAQTYTFRVTPTGQGLVTAQVSAGAAVDASGNVNTASNAVSRTFDSTISTPTLVLAPGSDSGQIGDLRTDQGTVTLNGTAEAGSTVTLTTTTAPAAPGTGPVIATTTAAADGSFTFSNVGLGVGPNSFVVRSTDAAGNVATFAQTFTRNAPPTVASAIGDQEFDSGDAAQTFDLSAVFNDVERVVRLSVSYPTGQTATLDINLFPGVTPQTVANFLAYVNSSNPAQSYDGSIFHRLVKGFVLQGGGFTFDDTTNTFTALTKMAPVVNEPGVSNTIGTIAMAKTGNDPNSATDEFFFNLGDNSANLDQQNGGFTVFGQVMGGGLSVLNSISNAVTTFSGSGIPGAPPFPVSPTANTSNFPQNITAADLIKLTTATELTTAQKLTFEVIGNTDPTVATVGVSGSTLTVTPGTVPAGTVGTTMITVKATDLDGSSTTTTFKVTVNGP